MPLAGAARERALACVHNYFAFSLLHAAGALEMKLLIGYSAVPAGVLPVRLHLPERQVYSDGDAHKEKTPGPPQGLLFVRVDPKQVFVLSRGAADHSQRRVGVHRRPRSAETPRYSVERGAIIGLGSILMKLLFFV